MRTKSRSYKNFICSSFCVGLFILLSPFTAQAQMQSEVWNTGSHWASGIRSNTSVDFTYGTLRIPYSWSGTVKSAQGTWRKTINACCTAFPSRVDIQATMSAGAIIRVRARSASSASVLSSATWGPYVNSGEPLQVAPGAFFEIQMLMNTPDSRVSPRIYGATVWMSYFNNCTIKRVNGSCQSLCPSTCVSDSDCSPSRCGERNKCVSGQCVDSNYKSQCHAPSLLVILDRSCSMKFTGGSLVDSGNPCSSYLNCTDYERYSSSSQRACKWSASKGYNTCHYTRWDVAVKALKRVFVDYGGTSQVGYEDRKVRYGFMTFDSYANIRSALYTNPPSLVSTINGIYAGGGTNYTRAFTLAKTHIKSAYTTDPIKQRVSAVLFITDGDPNDGCNTPQTKVSELYSLNNPVTNSPYKIKTYVVGFGSGLSSSGRSCLTALAKKGQTDRAKNCTTGSCLSYYAADNAASLVEAFRDIINNATEEKCDGLDNDCDGEIDEGNPGGNCTCNKSFTKPDSTSKIEFASKDYTDDKVRLYTFMASTTNRGDCSALPKINGESVVKLYESVCRNNQRKALGCSGAYVNPQGDAHKVYCGRCCGLEKSNICYWGEDSACRKTPWNASLNANPTTCYNACVNFCKTYKTIVMNCVKQRGVLMRTGSGYNSNGQLTIVGKTLDYGKALKKQNERHIFVNLPNMEHRNGYAANNGSLMLSLIPDKATYPTTVSGSFPNTANIFKASNQSLTPAMLGIEASHCGTTFECQAELSQTISQLRGVDSTGASFRTYRLGPIYHSNPVIISAPPANSTDSNYNLWRTQSATGGQVYKRPSMVYVGSNDGMMHAFLANAKADGNLFELWSFIPQTVLGKLRSAAGGHRPGGGPVMTVDGTPVIKNVQTYRYTNSSGVTVSKWRTVMVFGLRAGGRGYVALDVTDPYKPRLLWEINNNSYKDPFNQSLGRFTKLGYTFGKPSIANVMIDFDGKLQERAVAILPGGIGLKINSGPPVRELNKLDAVTGRAIFVVDLETGRLLRELIPPQPRILSPKFTAQGVSGTPVAYNALPAVASRFFVGNLQGQIFRVGLQSKHPSSWQVRLFHDLYDHPSITTPLQAGAVIRKPIMEAPAISANQAGELVLLGGTGDMIDLEAVKGFNLLYSLKENFALEGAVGNITGLLDESKVLAVPNFVVKLNKTMTMDSNDRPSIQSTATSPTGEKFTGEAIIFDGSAYFTTYTPTGSLPICGVTGFSRIYALRFDRTCRTASCWQGLLNKSLVSSSVTPIRCCEQGGGTSGSCNTSNKNPWSDYQLRTALKNGFPYCSDLDFTEPRLVEPGVPEKYYRYRMIGRNSLAMGPSFSFQPGETTLRRVDPADSSKGHSFGAVKTGKYFLSLQTAGRVLATGSAFRLSTMRVVLPTSDPNKTSGNFISLRTASSQPPVLISSWGAVLD